MSEVEFSQKSDLLKIPCVYEAWLDGLCVYVGQTDNLRRRFYAHKFQFDKVVAHTEVSKALRLHNEKTLIKKLKPTFNVQRPLSRLKNKPVGSTVSKNDIIGCYCEWVS